MANERPEKTEPEETIDSMEGLSQEQRIEKLRERIAELTDGQMTFQENDDVPPEIMEAFLSNVAVMEEAGWSVPAERLKEGGLELTPPDELDDEALHNKLWEVIHAMALRNMYVTSTDHLSDRELYTVLLEELHEEGFMGPPTPTPGSSYVFDLVDSGSEEDTYLTFKYYADDKYRRYWLKQFPDYEMPAREKPPYDRDRFLPQLDWTAPEPDEDDDEFLDGEFLDDEFLM
ncbi:MAG: hypothetical protein GY856_50965 [bacterium]|nr:hypothetical protein [bacterium]